MAGSESGLFELGRATAVEKSFIVFESRGGHGAFFFPCGASESHAR
jgi:hypothetical protein